MSHTASFEALNSRHTATLKEDDSAAIQPLGSHKAGTASIPDARIWMVIRRLMTFPFPQICVHSVAADLLSLLEEHGGTAILSPSKLQDLARAIVKADNESVLLILADPKFGANEP